VVGDEHVDGAEPLDGMLDHRRRSSGLAEVGLDVLQALPDPPAQVLEQALDATGVRTPRLLGVVRRPRVDQDVGAIGEQAACHREPDAPPAADPRDDGDPLHSCRWSSAMKS
jgi:hypothetical protein